MKTKKQRFQKLQNGINHIKERKNPAMEAELNESQSVISNYFSDCLDDNTTTSDKEENVGESQSQDLFEPTAKKAKID